MERVWERLLELEIGGGRGREGKVGRARESNIEQEFIRE